MTLNTQLPAIVITTGEPAGVGPELAVKLASRSWNARILFLGDPDFLAAIAHQENLNISIHTAKNTASIPPHQAGSMTVLPVTLNHDVTTGTLNTVNSAYVIQQLAQAGQLCLDQTTSAVVTAPVHKGIINDAGIEFKGHTEFFAHQSGTPKVVMLLAGRQIRVALASTHLPLSKVPQAITKASLRKIITIIHASMRQNFSIEQPVIKVLGLNPHAGEGGHLGTEEIETIIPVIKEFQEKGYNIRGPFPADTAFGNEKKPADADVILAMYHDQGLPVLKFHHFSESANITLGLPYIRTSVDHGTALDIAGKHLAESGSFQFALQQAIQMAKLQNSNHSFNGGGNEFIA